MIFWAIISMIGYDSCALARPTCSSKGTHTNRAARLLTVFSFRTGWTVRGEARLAGLLFRSAVAESPLPQGSPRTTTAVIRSDIARQAGPATPSPDGACARCRWRARKIHDALRSRPSPKRSNGGAWCYRSVHIRCKLQRQEVLWHRSTLSLLAPSGWRRCWGACGEATI